MSNDNNVGGAWLERLMPSDVTGLQTRLDRLRQNLPTLRRAAGWSAQDLASMLGVSRQTIVNLENGANLGEPESAENKGAVMTPERYLAVRRLLDARIMDQQSDAAIPPASRSVLENLIIIFVDSDRFNDLDRNDLKREINEIVSKVGRRSGSETLGAVLRNALAEGKAGDEDFILYNVMKENIDPNDYSSVYIGKPRGETTHLASVDPVVLKGGELVPDGERLDRMRKNIKYVRNAAGWSADNLAQLLGCSRQTVVNLESDEGSMTVERFLAIDSLLDARLLDETDEGRRKILADVRAVLIDGDGDEEYANKIKEKIDSIAGESGPRPGSSSLGKKVLTGIAGVAGIAGIAVGLIGYAAYKLFAGDNGDDSAALAEGESAPNGEKALPENAVPALPEASPDASADAGSQASAEAGNALGDTLEDLRDIVAPDSENLKIVGPDTGRSMLGDVDRQLREEAEARGERGIEAPPDAPDASPREGECDRSAADPEEDKAPGDRDFGLEIKEMKSQISAIFELLSESFKAEKASENLGSTESRSSGSSTDGLRSVSPLAARIMANSKNQNAISFTGRSAANAGKSAGSSGEGVTETTSSGESKAEGVTETTSSGESSAEGVTETTSSGESKAERIPEGPSDGEADEVFGGLTLRPGAMERMKGYIENGGVTGRIPHAANPFENFDFGEDDDGDPAADGGDPAADERETVAEIRSIRRMLADAEQLAAFPTKIKNDLRARVRKLLEQLPPETAAALDDEDVPTGQGAPIGDDEPDIDASIDGDDGAAWGAFIDEDDEDDDEAPDFAALIAEYAPDEDDDEAPDFAALIAEYAPDEPTYSAPTDSAPADSAPTDSAPTDSAPADSAPTDSAPTDGAQAFGLTIGEYRRRKANGDND